MGRQIMGHLVVGQLVGLWRVLKFETHFNFTCANDFDLMSTASFSRDQNK